MSVTVKGTGQKKSQSKESGLNIAGVSPTSGFFFTSPFRSLSTQGCFAKITLPAAGGDQVNGEFQREVRHAFAEAKLAGVKSPVLCGAIPFDTHQPSALFIPQQTQWFERDAFLADVTPPQDALPEITRQTEVPAQQPFMQMVADAVQATRGDRLDKVVLSRLLEIETREPVDRQALMARIIAQNPNGFHFHVPLERGRWWAPARNCCCANPARSSTPTRWQALPAAMPIRSETVKSANGYWCRTKTFMSTNSSPKGCARYWPTAAAT